MPTKQVLDAIDSDINWRITEIGYIKMNATLLSFNPDRKAALLRYSIPALYSVWEGFVVNTLTEYSREINSLCIPVDRVNIDMLTHNVYDVFDLQNTRGDYEKKRTLIERIFRYMRSGTINLSPVIDTESNVNYKVLVKLHRRLNLDLPEESTFISDLNKYVNIRNKIAHGDNSISIDSGHLSEFSNCIINLMNSERQIIENSLRSNSYTCDPIQ